MSLDEAVYIRQVAELGGKMDVTASEDIYAPNGMKLLARGARINRSTLTRLLRYKLQKPIDQTTLIDEAVTPDGLVATATVLMDQDTALSEAIARARDRRFASRVVRRIHFAPAILNKLTVAHNLHAELFQHGLYVMLLASLLGEQLGCSDSELSLLATAGLLHDIGMLHLEVLGLPQSAELTWKQWLQVRSHPRVGSLVLSAHPAYEQAAQAVSEHHERIDGSGYPVGRTGSQTSRAGRILGVADFVAASAEKRGMRHMSTILKTQLHLFDREAVQGVAAILPESLDPAGSAVSPRLSTQAQHELFKALSDTLAAAPLGIDCSCADSAPARALAALRTTVEHIAMMMRRAGFEIGRPNHPLMDLGSDRVLQVELDSLLEETCFQLRPLLHELRWHMSTQEPQIQPCEALDAWLDTTESLLKRTQQALRPQDPKR